MFQLLWQLIMAKKYICEQIDSILNQLGEKDELVISDDNSTDSTAEIIAGFLKRDKRLKLLKSPRKGIVKNFENAINNCSNELIFLSDQDDIWDDNKIYVLLSCFEESNADLILHNARILYDDNNQGKELFFDKRGCKKGIINNIVKNSYMGCCMAFRKEMKEYFLPFPKNIPMHDQWIGIICEKYGQVLFLDAPLISYRRHSSNASNDSPSSILTRLKWRLTLVTCFVYRILKIKKGNQKQWKVKYSL